MKNFQPGGLRNRRDDIGGRPRSDADKYAPKKRFEANNSDRGSRFGGSDRAPRFDNKDKADVKLYDAICTTCGKSCEVPFRPDGSKPVLCRDCFAAKNASPMTGDRTPRFDRNESAPKREFSAPKPQAPAVSKHDYDQLVKQIVNLEGKVNQILELVRSTEKETTHKTVTITENVEEVAGDETPKKVRKPKKVTPAITKAAVKKKATVAKKVAKKKATTK